MRRATVLVAMATAILFAGAVSLVAVQEPAEATFPGENGKMVFSSSTTVGKGVDNPEGDKEIFTLNPDGTGLTQVTHNASYEYEPAWSPDGARIVFRSTESPDERGDFEIFTIPVGGGEITRVTDNETDDTEPAWSPDGSEIAYVGQIPDDPTTTQYDPKEALYKVPAGGGQPTVVHDGYANSPEWSPDGSEIAFIQRLSFWAVGSLSTVPADGGTTTTVAPRAITMTSDGRASGIDWSPDGSKIAYVAEDATPVKPGYADLEIWTVNANGDNPTDLTDVHDVGGRDQYQPEWSPDGSKIAYLERGYGTCSPGAAIWTVPQGGGTPTRVTELVSYQFDGLDWGSASWQTAPDTEPPTVVCTNSDVQADFSEEVDPATLTSDTFYLTNETSGERVEATVGCASATRSQLRFCRSAFLEPTATLESNTTYTATIKGGESGVKDLAGNALAADKTWSFPTRDTLPPDISITAPTDGATVSGSNVTISADAFDGTEVDDVTFYVDRQRVGTDYTASGSSGNEYSVSWNSTGVRDGQKTIKVVAWDTRNNWASATTPVTVDNVPDPPDTTSPRVKDTKPNHRKEDVGRGTAVSAIFSEQMEAATLDAATVRMLDTRSGQRVAAAVECNDQCTRVELDLSNRLAANTRYRVTVTPGAEDLAGNALDQQPNVAGDQKMTWTFTTERWRSSQRDGSR